MQSTQSTQSMPSFCPIEINGQKYLLCKLPDQPFSTLHDPDTKEIVGQWNNHTAQHEIFAAPGMTPQQFDEHMRELIASGAAFTFV
jgi:hypothetical protein